MYISRHAAERLSTRFTPGETGLLIDRARAAAVRGRKVAVVVDRQPVLRDTGLDVYGDRASNGDLTVAIVSWEPPMGGMPVPRDPELVTVMFRRSGQPLRADRLDVSAVKYALG